MRAPSCQDSYYSRLLENISLTWERPWGTLCPCWMYLKAECETLYLAGKTSSMTSMTEGNRDNDKQGREPQVERKIFYIFSPNKPSIV